MRGRSRSGLLGPGQLGAQASRFGLFGSQGLPGRLQRTGPLMQARLGRVVSLRGPVALSHELLMLPLGLPQLRAGRFQLRRRRGGLGLRGVSQIQLGPDLGELGP